jgi:NAD(P)-dependent dehydrogenase (short-subunit alcohol dehydrogenase family)
MPGRLADQVAIITGAAGGIGGAAVRLFAAEGARVVALDREPVDPPSEGRAEQVDLTEPGQVREVVASVREEFGRIDVLFNVAGASGRRHGDGPVHECTDEGWDWVLNVNLRTVFHCCREVVPAMLGAGGSIVNVSSVLGLVGHPRFDSHAYAASKGAIIALTRAMAARYASERIRVNVLCPGLVRTAMSLRAQSDPEVLAALADLQPLTDDFAEPEDVAAAALFLASEESRFVTGTVLPVDGGWTAR